ncbi:MAG TPA: hypothetical protein VII11_03680, partial [Bacteroidota bacterium]
VAAGVAYGASFVWNFEPLAVESVVMKLALCLLFGVLVVAMRVVSFRELRSTASALQTKSPSLL